MLEPTQAEIDDWATRERQRRQAWLDGPSADEQAAYAQRVASVAWRRRRRGRAAHRGHRPSSASTMGARRSSRPRARWPCSIDGRDARFLEFVRAGREWEEETSLPVRRRRGRSMTRRPERRGSSTGRRLAPAAPASGERVRSAPDLLAGEDVHPSPAPSLARLRRPSSGSSSPPPCICRGPIRSPAPVGMRLAFERLGGAWIKLGQMLALRYDVLPAAYCDELFKLLNQVAPFPYDEVRDIVAPGVGCSAGGRVRVVRRGVVRGRLHRPGAPRRPP